MTSRISGGAIGPNPYGPQWGTGETTSDGSSSIGAQVEDSLFGRKRPTLVEEDADTSALLARLDVFRRKLARLAGDAPEDYRLQLAAGTIAAIDVDGIIYVGKGFLLDTAEVLPLQVGVLAHEIGHRPQRWKAYRAQKAIEPDQLADLCRLEETRADYFAGYALAHLRMTADPVCLYLHRVQTQPHPEYFSAELREKTIREGFVAGERRQSNLRKFFPELARVSGVASDLGDA